MTPPHAGPDGGPRPLRLRPRPHRRRVFIVRRALAAAIIVACAAVIWLAVSIFQPLHGSGQGKVQVTIPSGAGTSRIATILERSHVISSAFFFKLRATLDGDRGRLRAGTYDLRRDMSYGAVLGELMNPAANILVNVTITPGRSRAQVQALLHAARIGGDYVRLTRSSPLLDPQRYGAPAHVHSLEGFLWPDTYALTRPVSIRRLIALQLTRFRQEFGRVSLAYARAHNLTAYDVLTIASLISGEALRTRDQPLVASVIYNRLRDGMDLGLDSTVEYATGHYGTLTEHDLQSSSPWNTRNHPGLPPTPINSPDLQLLEAAAHPARTDYLYFINRVCGNGALRFTASYAQFLRWSAQWSAAVRRARTHGGSPEFCRSTP